MCKAEPHGTRVAAICLEQKSLVLRPTSPAGDGDEPALAEWQGQSLTCLICVPSSVSWACWWTPPWRRQMFPESRRNENPSPDPNPDSSPNPDPSPRPNPHPSLDPANQDAFLSDTRDRFP